LQETVNSLLPVFEEFLDKAPDSGSFDAVRQSVVILMGSLARHLERDDRKVKPIVAKLIDALSTPSQQVHSPSTHFYHLIYDMLLHLISYTGLCFSHFVMSTHGKGL
jgi:hypothetical protein